MKLQLSKLIIIPVVFLALAGTALAQTSNNTRERLNERLSVLIERQASKDYENIYDDLLSRSETTKEIFVQSNRKADVVGRRTLSKFVPQHIFLREPENLWGFVTGCGEFKEKGRTKYFEAQVEATYENGDWYFAAPVYIDAVFGRKPKGCSINVPGPNTNAKKDPFADVPEGIRGDLEKKLSTLVSFQKAKMYNELYGLLSDDTRKTNSKETFVRMYESADKNGTNNALTAFLPREVYSIYSDNYWLIKGCGTFEDSDGASSYDSQVVAVFENNNWYFTSLIGAGVGLGSNLKNVQCRNECDGGKL